MIELRKMTEIEYANYLAVALPNYAEEKMRGEGLSKEDAMKLARDSYARLLPNGIATENHFIFAVVQKESNKVIGTLWFGKKIEGAKASAY
ncbi:MAG: hypothetical protein EOO38_10950, partial [Cytophagaceae bacterium]